MAKLGMGIGEYVGTILAGVSALDDEALCLCHQDANQSCRMVVALVCQRTADPAWTKHCEMLSSCGS